MIASNNRFLQRVNPEITRALADSGSSLERSEIQQLMRQMVDLGIADNLKLWVHSGLVKTRTSGSDLFVPKAYDISGEENDAAQTTEANQPKLVSLGMEFDGSSDRLVIPHSTDLQINKGGTVALYVLAHTKGSNNFSRIIQKGLNATNDWALRLSNPGVDSYTIIFNVNDGTAYSLSYSGVAYNTYYHIAVTYGTGGLVNLCIDGVSVGSDTFPTDFSNSEGASIGAYHQNSVAFWDGIINDIRIYNTALTSIQITAIYNATKSKYGH